MFCKVFVFYDFIDFSKLNFKYLMNKKKFKFFFLDVFIYNFFLNFVLILF